MSAQAQAQAPIASPGEAEHAIAALYATMDRLEATASTPRKVSA